MRVAILTEGDSEYGAIPLLFEQLRQVTGNEFVQVMRIAVQPDGPPEKIARECEVAFKVCAVKKVSRVIVVLDREQRTESPGEIAAAIERAISDRCNPDFEVFVVMKDRAFENWVIADLDAIRAQPRRFNLTPRVTNAVAPNRADRADALGLLRASTIGRSYDKRDDSKRTFSRAQISRIAANSRSFRHFLHKAGDGTYAAQCKQPA